MAFAMAFRKVISMAVTIWVSMRLGQLLCTTQPRGPSAEDFSSRTGLDNVTQSVTRKLCPRNWLHAWGTQTSLWGSLNVCVGTKIGGRTRFGFWGGSRDRGGFLRF